MKEVMNIHRCSNVLTFESNYNNWQDAKDLFDGDYEDTVGYLTVSNSFTKASISLSLNDMKKLKKELNKKIKFMEGK